jgi:nuclear pore complex protein Nup54
MYPLILASFASSQYLGEKPIQEQIESLTKRWAPDFPDCAFQTYLYNAVPESELPFFVPTPADDGRKWEEALQKRPTPNSVPVLARGFQMLGQRMENQNQAAQILRNRLHDIHKCLEERLQKHDTETTIRARKARQKHQALSRRCLALATKVQVLRNRGYALDRTEEELRQKLTELEKQAFDPVLNGRQEEIWARMAVVRERAEMIAQETKRLGDAAQQAAQDEQLMSEKEKETIKKVRHKKNRHARHHQY